MPDTPCPECQDTGWAPAEAGGRAGVRRCGCVRVRQGVVRLERARIPKRFQKCNFANFSLLQNETLKNAAALARKVLDNYPSQEIGLLFIGPPGVGKTHLAVALLSDLIRAKGVTGLFYDFRDLIRNIQETFSGESGRSESDVISPVFNADVVLFDELGAKRPTAWVEETIYSIVNYRYNNKKLTLFTSNFQDVAEDPESERQTTFKRQDNFKKEDDSLVERIGYRLRSRIYEMCKFVPMEGIDFRKIFLHDGYKGKV